jgi:hypothetical protein
MDFKRSASGLIELNGKVRIERSAPRRREMATVELLADEVTASHYAVGLPDALGNIIALGEPFDFIDYIAEKAGKGVFVVYLLTEVTDVVAGAEIKNMRFLPQGSPYETEEAALSQAIPLATA